MSCFQDYSLGTKAWLAKKADKCLLVIELLSSSRGKEGNSPFLSFMSTA